MESISTQIAHLYMRYKTLKEECETLKQSLEKANIRIKGLVAENAHTKKKCAQLEKERNEVASIFTNMCKNLEKIDKDSTTVEKIWQNSKNSATVSSNPENNKNKRSSFHSVNHEDQIIKQKTAVRNSFVTEKITVPQQPIAIGQDAETTNEKNMARSSISHGNEIKEQNKQFSSKALVAQKPSSLKVDRDVDGYLLPIYNAQRSGEKLNFKDCPRVALKTKSKPLSKTGSVILREQFEQKRNFLDSKKLTESLNVQNNNQTISNAGTTNHVEVNLLPRYEIHTITNNNQNFGTNSTTVLSDKPEAITIQSNGPSNDHSHAVRTDGTALLPLQYLNLPNAEQQTFAIANIGGQISPLIKVPPAVQFLENGNVPQNTEPSFAPANEVYQQSASSNLTVINSLQFSKLPANTIHNESSVTNSVVGQVPISYGIQLVSPQKANTSLPIQNKPPILYVTKDKAFYFPNIPTVSPQQQRLDETYSLQNKPSSGITNMTNVTPLANVTLGLSPQYSNLIQSPFSGPSFGFPKIAKIVTSGNNAISSQSQLFYHC